MPQESWFSLRIFLILTDCGIHSHLKQRRQANCRVEMCLRIFALGLIDGPNTYLASSKYNQLDCLIVLSSWALKAMFWAGVFQPIFPGMLMPVHPAIIEFGSYTTCCQTNIRYLYNCLTLMDHEPLRPDLASSHGITLCSIRRSWFAAASALNPACLLQAGARA